MDEGPSTIRPNVPLAQTLNRFEQQNTQTALVTTSDGRLIGVIRRPSTPSLTT